MNLWFRPLNLRLNWFNADPALLVENNDLKGRYHPDLYGILKR